MTDTPPPIELPRCPYCEAPATTIVWLDTEHVVYVCDAHDNQWALNGQEDMPDA